MPALTVSNLIGLMQHALGKTPDSRHDLYETLNEAGRELTTRYSWSWRMNARATITGTASQSYLTLPADFAQLVAVTADISAGYSVAITTVDDIEQMRQVGVSAPSGMWWVAFGDWASQASTTVSRVQRAAIYPTPTSNGTPSLSLKYKAQWTEFTSADGAKVPNIPIEFQTALKHKARALACAIENNTQQAVWEALYEKSIAQLIYEEGNQQIEVGRMRGGADSFCFGSEPDVTYGTEATFNGLPGD